LTRARAPHTLRAVPSPASSRRIELALAGMQFHVCVGILPHERELPQPLEIDLWVALVEGAQAVLDYRELYEIASSIVGQGPLGFLETAGDAIATVVLARPEVDRVRVTLRKPHVALPGPLAYAQVVVERSRG
jgi:dihydroneopterin aldolase